MVRERHSMSSSGGKNGPETIRHPEFNGPPRSGGLFLDEGVESSSAVEFDSIEDATAVFESIGDARLDQNSGSR